MGIFNRGPEFRITDFIGWELDDVTILPAPQSELSSRSNAEIYKGTNYLPIFTAPMTTVVGLTSYGIYDENRIYAILPRTVGDLTERITLHHQGYSVSFSLEEFITIGRHCLFNTSLPNGAMILVDMAQGHLTKLVSAIKQFKSNYHTPVMVGNIAHWDILPILDKAGADYVRCGIGGGSGCLTSTLTGVHTPMATLLDNCKYIKEEQGLRIKLVADGGINGYANIIKCLALGADYVMLGRELASTNAHDSLTKWAGILKSDYTSPDDESIGQQYERFSRSYDFDPNLIAHGSSLPSWLPQGTILNTYEQEKRVLLDDGYYKNPVRLMHGMASNVGSHELGKECKSSEGLDAYEVPITKTIEDWVLGFEGALKSAMSYLNVSDIESLVNTHHTLIPHITRGFNK